MVFSMIDLLSSYLLFCNSETLFVAYWACKQSVKFSCTPVALRQAISSVPTLHIGAHWAAGLLELRTNPVLVHEFNYMLTGTDRCILMASSIK